MKEIKKMAEENQELSNGEIVELMETAGVSYRKLSKIHSRSISQVYYSIHSPEYPGLRSRIIKYLQKKVANVN